MPLKQLECVLFSMTKGDLIRQDGFGLDDISPGMELISSAIDVAKADFGALKGEIEDLDETEKNELARVFIANFDLVNNDIEYKVEIVVTLVIKLLSNVKEILETLEKLKTMGK